MNSFTALKKNAQETSEDAIASGQSAERTLRDAAEDAGQKVRSFVQNNSEKAVDFYKTTEHAIVQNPMKAVAVAAVGGLLLGALLRR